MRGRPRQPLSGSSRRSIYSKDFGLLLVPLVGAWPHGAGLVGMGVAAVGILFFIKKKAPRPKPAEKKEEKEEQEEEREDPTLEKLLSKAKFPIVSKRDLLKALGGARSMVKVDSTLVPAREIVDRCFSKSKRFVGHDGSGPGEPDALPSIHRGAPEEVAGGKLCRRGAHRPLLTEAAVPG